MFSFDSELYLISTVYDSRKSLNTKWHSKGDIPKAVGSKSGESQASCSSLPYMFPTMMLCSSPRKGRQAAQIKRDLEFRCESLLYYSFELGLSRGAARTGMLDQRWHKRAACTKILFTHLSITSLILSRDFSFGWTSSFRAESNGRSTIHSSQR